MSMVNEMSSMSSTVIPNEKHIETNDFSKKQSQNKYNKVCEYLLYYYNGRK